MGDIYLLKAPEAIQDYGLEVELLEGWQFRSRSSGGFEEVLAIGTHHDAIPEGVPTANRVISSAINAPFAPVGNMILAKNPLPGRTLPRVIFYAAGASNTQGRSEKAHVFSRGVVPRSKGNLYIPAIEAENNGVGEDWPEPQLEAYEILCAALCDYASLNPITDIIHHHTYTNRKIDPRSLDSNPKRDYEKTPTGEWDQALFNARAHRKVNRLPNLVALDFLACENPHRFIDTRTGLGLPARLKGGEIHTIKAPWDCKGLSANIVAIDPLSRGFISVWSSGALEKTSKLNYNDLSTPVGNEVFIPCKNNHFKLYSNSDVDLVMDIAGIWR